MQHILRRCAGLAVAVGALLALTQAARADLQLCNRTSYVLNLALGLETKGTAATRGWFRSDPGQCLTVLNGTLEADRVLIHARAHPVYGNTPMPEGTAADLCIADGNFVVAGAHRCMSAGQYLARFAAVQPSDVDGILTANIAEEDDYDADQSRRAGIQRLLTLAGYDAKPIDGLVGPRTEAALSQFLRDRRLEQAASAAPGFFDTLIDAAKQADSVGLTWCNDTAHVVMAAVGIEEKGSVITKGWFRVSPGGCTKPDFDGKPRRVFSFAEAIDADGQVVRRGARTLSWGGPTLLCTRALKFEVEDHRNCAADGYTASGFATVDLVGRSGATVRFRE